MLAHTSTTACIQDQQVITQGKQAGRAAGCRTREVREWWWILREARSADSRLEAERMTVRQVKPARGWRGVEEPRQSACRRACGDQCWDARVAHWSAGS